MKHTKTALRLRSILNERGMRPQELADKSGIGKSSISQYVNGSHKPSNLSAGKMAKVLDCDPMWLMGFDDPEEIIVDMFNQEEDERLAFIIKAYQNAEESDRRLIYAAAIVAAGEER